MTDQERALSMTVKVEADRLRRNVGTLRRIAALAPLLGLLGTLMATARARWRRPGTEWALALGLALAPLTAGVARRFWHWWPTTGLVARVDALRRQPRTGGDRDRRCDRDEHPVGTSGGPNPPLGPGRNS